MDFNNVDELLKRLASDVAKATISDIKEDMIDVLHDESLKIYDEFTPTTYIRRYDIGGFGDRGNITFKVMKANDRGISMMLKNETYANGDDEGSFLDYFIVKGKYKWSHKPDKRPVYDRAMDRIKSEDLLSNSLKKALGEDWDFE